MGRITPSFRQLYEEVMSELRTELQGAFVTLAIRELLICCLSMRGVLSKQQWEILHCQQSVIN